MKVIFLDFNGILDTYDNMDEIDSDNLNRLKRIVECTDAKVVLTTSNKNNYYRSGKIRGMLKYIIDSLLDAGIDVVGMVPMMNSREEEIQAYLDVHDEVECFVILDDDYDMPSFKNNLIKLPCQMIGFEQTGLEDKHVNEAIKILGRSISKENIEYKSL